MTPGEIKGYARQAMKRKELSPEEKTAISMLIDGLDAMLAVAPIIAKANHAIKHDKKNSAEPPADPNTGWKGGHSTSGK